jgi:hypothetical protein
MATRSLTYLDIPEDIRREAAGRARTNLRALLVSPAYTQEQRAEIVAQIEHISQWEAGLLSVTGAPVAPPAKPTFLGFKPGFG